jgi:hypothetical protein
VFFVGFAALTVVILLFGVNTALVVEARARAQTAADAAALGAAPLTFDDFGSQATPSDEAARLANRNGARLTQCTCVMNRSWQARVVTVTVVVDRQIPGFARAEIRAEAQAEFSPRDLLP